MRRSRSPRHGWLTLLEANVISRDEKLDLTGISWHWESAYRVALNDGIWSAIPHTDPSVILTADTADELRTLIRTDYTQRNAKPVPLLGERMST